MPTTSSSTELNAKLIKRIDLNPELALFQVRPDEGPAPEFEPGQFATLGLPDDEQPEPADKPDSPARRRRRGPKLIRRAYSIASPSTNRDYLEFYIVMVKDGKLTPRLWELNDGDPLFMGPKIAGHFTLESVPAGKNLVMVGTGTGLAPFVSMYETYRDTGRWNQFVLFDGCRYCPDLGYLDRMERYAQEDPSLQYCPTVTREPADSDWPGCRGRVTEYLQPGPFRERFGFDLNPADTHVFLCGNPAMIDQCEAELTTAGFVVKDREHPGGNLHFERYW